MCRGARRMTSGSRISKKSIRLIIAAAVVLAAAAAFALWRFGVIETAQLNSHSLMDWRLGGSIDSVHGAQDAMVYDETHYEWFSDDDGEGISSKGTDTRYYLGERFGSYRVLGFSSSEDYYSVLGIRVGDDELDAKTKLLNSGYSMLGGGFNSCRAHRGCVTVELNFEHGVVTNIAAYIK